MRDMAFRGTPPRGAVVNSGTVSATTAITAGHIIINGITLPGLGVPSPATAAQRVSDIVDLINAHQTLTGALAVRLTATTWSLRCGKAITGTLGASATVATFGFVTSLSGSLTPVLLATRKAMGTGLSTDDNALVQVGAQWFPVSAAKAMGMVADGPNGDIEYDVAQTPTRTNN